MNIIAWKGNALIHRENTLESISSVPSDIDIIEVDTRLSKDGVLVAYHSPTMQVHGDPRSISDVTWDELQSLIMMHKGREYHIPRVIDLINSSPTKIFLLHAKRENDIDMYLAAIREFPFCYFHSNSYDHLLALYASGKKCKLFKSIWRPVDDIIDFVDGYMLGHHIFKGVTAVSEELISKLRTNKKTIFIFAGISNEWISSAISYKPDGFLTYRFDRARKVLKEQGYV